MLTSRWSIRGPSETAAQMRALIATLQCPDLSCSGLVTTPAKVVEEGSGLGGDARLGGHLLGADGDGG